MKMKAHVFWKKLFVLLLSVSMLCAQPLGGVMAEGPQPEIVDGFPVSEAVSEKPALETPGESPVDVPAEPFKGTAEENVKEPAPPVEHDSEAKARNVYRFNRTFDGIPEDNVIYEQTVVDGDIIQSFEIASQLNGYIFRAMQYSDGRPFHFDDPVAVDQQSDGAVIDVLLSYESPVQNYQVYLSKDGTIADVPLYEQEVRNGSTLELPSQILPDIEGYSLQGLTYEDGSPFDPDAAIMVSPEEDGLNKIILAQYVADKVEEEETSEPKEGEKEKEENLTAAAKNSAPRRIISPIKDTFTYIFKVDDKVVDRQIVKNGESLNEPKAPEKKTKNL